MKTFNKILIAMLCFVSMTSCLVDDVEPSLIYGEGLNFGGFNDASLNFGGVADGNSYDFNIEMEVKGPTHKEIASDVTLTVAVDPSSTAIEGTHFSFVSKTITVSPNNNFLGQLPIKMLSKGIVAPLAEAPVLVLKVVSATGANNLVNNGKLLRINFNYLCFSNLAKTYDVRMRYVRSASGIDQTTTFKDTWKKTGSGEYRTGLVGHWSVADLGGTAGMTLLDVCNEITIPKQNLVDLYTNIVEGVAGKCSVNPETGVITMEYTITGGNLRQYYVTYTPVK